MSKNILLGIAGFGGLVLVASLSLNSPQEMPASSQEEVAIVVPADIPNFPIYTNSEVTSVRDTDGEEARDISITLSTSDSKSDIHDWYRAELSQNGWGIKSDKNVAGYQIIQGEKDNLYTSLQTASSDTGVTISQHLKVRK